MSRRTLVAFVLCALLAPAMAMAQPAPDNGGNGGGGGGGGGGGFGRRGGGGGGGGGGAGGGGGGGGFGDPAQFRQRMMDYYKTQLGASDDEWKVIEPKLTKVMDATRAARVGGGGFGFGGGGQGGGGGRRNGGGGGAGGPGGAAADSPVAKAQTDLRTALDNKDTSADDIAKKLTALRDAREKAKADLATAQKDLKDILTQRQEAVLVMAGQLD